MSEPTCTTAQMYIQGGGTSILGSGTRDRGAICQWFKSLARPLRRGGAPDVIVWAKLNNLQEAALYLVPIFPSLSSPCANAPITSVTCFPISNSKPPCTGKAWPASPCRTNLFLQ